MLIFSLSFAGLSGTIKVGYQIHSSRLLPLQGVLQTIAEALAEIIDMLAVCQKNTLKNNPFNRIGREGGNGLVIAVFFMIDFDARAGAKPAPFSSQGLMCLNSVNLATNQALSLSLW